MKISYDPEADAMYILFQDLKYTISKDIGDGIVADYGEDGKVIGIEILEVSQHLPADAIENIVLNIPHKGKVS